MPKQKPSFTRLAISNILKNGKFYLPYLLTCICASSMFYIICFISFNPGLQSLRGFDYVRVLLVLGCIIVGIFSAVFLFYTNSFLMKRRKKELGLYNILGMERRHIARVLTYETIYSAGSTLFLGLLLGILLSKLILLLLCNLTHLPAPLGFEVSLSGIITTVLVFTGIFFLILLSNLLRIHLSNPIELLHGGATGEREPKVKWLFVLVGLVTLGCGYYLSVSVQEPLSALLLFFLAVLLVIIGTYCLFIAGSIALLKLLRKNKRYYYKTKHFTSISGMLYRMKQNAAGLASICILSTMVLVTLSTTVSLYLGIVDGISSLYPRDITVSMPIPDAQEVAELGFEEWEEIPERITQVVEESGLTVTDPYSYISLSFTCGRTGDTFNGASFNLSNQGDAAIFSVLVAADYQRMTGEVLGLASNEVAVYSTARSRSLPERFQIFGQDYTVAEVLTDFPLDREYDVNWTDCYFLILPDMAAFQELDQAQFAAYTAADSYPSAPTYEMGFNFEAEDSDILACWEAIEASLQVETEEGSYLFANVVCRQPEIENFYALYGGFLFLGIYLGTLFLVATVLIIYYKQVSEGYDDKARYEILRQVGMSDKEVRTTVRSQILTVFFLPLCMAAVHTAAAFPMISKLLYLLNQVNTTLFAWCTIGTIAVFALVYGVVYGMTARVYYRIVRS